MAHIFILATYIGNEAGEISIWPLFKAQLNDDNQINFMQVLEVFQQRP
ncbi:hypothetical protein [uncultured Fibrella sp.]